MERTMTANFSLPLELKQQLDGVAKTIQHSTSWIVAEALKQYLGRYHRHRTLAEEARRQSIRASQYNNMNDALWEENSDDSEWKY